MFSTPDLYLEAEVSYRRSQLVADRQRVVRQRRPRKRRRWRQLVVPRQRVSSALDA